MTSLLLVPVNHNVLSGFGHVLVKCIFLYLTHHFLVISRVIVHVSKFLTSQGICHLRNIPLFLHKFGIY